MATRPFSVVRPKLRCRARTNVLNSDFNPFILLCNAAPCCQHNAIYIKFVELYPPLLSKMYARQQMR